MKVRTVSGADGVFSGGGCHQLPNSRDKRQYSHNRQHPIIPISGPNYKRSDRS